MDRPLTIEHEETKYVRDISSIACVSTDFRERITWSQAWEGEPPRRVLYLSGTARLEASTLVVLGAPATRADVMSLSIRAVDSDTLANLRQNLDLRSETPIGDPEPGTIEHAWPATIGHTAPHPEFPRGEHDWFCEVYVPEDIFEQLREAARQSTRLELNLQVPTYGERIDMDFGGNQRAMVFPGGEYGSPSARGRCADLTFVGANRFGAVDPDDPDEPPSVPRLLSSIDGRLNAMSAQMKTISQALLVLACATVVSAVALYFR